jgi:hypothetical protein
MTAGAAVHADTLAWYRFEDGAVDALATGPIVDSSTQGNDGTATGDAHYRADVPVSPVPLTGNANDLSLDLDGPADGAYFSSTFPFHDAGDATIEFWVKNRSGLAQDLIWSRSDDADLNRFNVFVTGGNVGMDYRTPSGFLVQLVQSPIPFDTWVHVAVTRAGSYYQLYVEGELVDEAEDTILNLPTALGWQISGRGCCYYNGLIDEVRISNAALTPREFLFNSIVDVEIDVKPGSDPNCFNLNGHGVIPVAINGRPDFDVYDIDVNTVLFDGLAVRVRGNRGPLCSIEDWNTDGFLDMVCHFEDDPANWVGGGSTATLTGNLLDGTPFEGTDDICIVP